MLFTNLALLGGLAALSIPILLHLLLKRKKQRLRFSTLEFFLKKDEQSTRRRKFRNLLLLAVRLLLLTMIILAFARPYLPKQLASIAIQKRREIVFVLDRSASMQASDANSLRWTRAKNSIEQILSELQPQDRVGLIGCSLQTDILSPLAEPDNIKRILHNLTPGFGTAELGDGLRAATKLLLNEDPTSDATIYIVSDLQRISSRNLTANPIPSSINVQFLNAGEIYAPNISVLELQLNPEGATKPHATIANFSDEMAKVKTTLLMNGKEVFSGTTELKPDTSAQIDLPLPELNPGWHEGEFRIHASDVFALDNTRYATIFIPQPTRVLVVEPRENKRVFEEESFFITSALQPSKTAAPHFVLEKIAVGELVKKLSEQNKNSRYSFVVLPALREIPSDAGKALSEFVRAGGGLLFFLGETASANRYNAEFREFLPAQLERVEESLLAWHLETVAKNAAIFDAFQNPNSGNLNLPEFTRRFTLTTKTNSRVLAEFDDGAPLLVESADGKIILINTSADTRWTDWPKHKTFVPWLHGIGNYLAGNSKELRTKNLLNFTATEETDFDLGVSAKQRLFHVRRAGAQEISVTADERGHLQNLNFGTPGIYSIHDEISRELRRVAVNLPTEESDLSALTPNQFQQQLARISDTAQSPRAAGFFQSQNNQDQLWRMLLVTGLVLLISELVLANRTFS